jgi:hypothetical protein
VEKVCSVLRMMDSVGWPHVPMPGWPLTGLVTSPGFSFSMDKREQNNTKIIGLR